MTDAFSAALAAAFDVRKWAADMARKLPAHTAATFAFAQQDWDRRKAQLRDTDPEAYRRLNLLLAERAKEITNG